MLQLAEHRPAWCSLIPRCPSHVWFLVGTRALGRKHHFVFLGSAPCIPLASFVSSGLGQSVFWRSTSLRNDYFFCIITRLPKSRAFFTFNYVQITVKVTISRRLSAVTLYSPCDCDVHNVLMGFSSAFSFWQMLKHFWSISGRILSSLFTTRQSRQSVKVSSCTRLSLLGGYKIRG